MSKVWLITGSGNGLGQDIAEAALLSAGIPQLSSERKALSVNQRKHARCFGRGVRI